MKQFTFNCASTEILKAELEKFAEQGYEQSKMMFSVYMNTPSESVKENLCSVIEEVFPDADYMGCSTGGTIIDCELAGQAVVVCTVFEKPETIFEICQAEFTWDNIEEVADRLVKKINDEPDIKCVEIYFSILSGYYMRFCERMDNVRKGVQIIGGIIANDGVTTDECCVFSKKHGYSDKSVIAVLYGGNDFNIKTVKITGWKQLKRTFHITKANACVINEIDGCPAYDLYGRYLGIPNDENFFYNTLEFPLYYEHNGIDILRAPVACNEDGSITISSDIDEGAAVQFSYGDPKTIFECVEEDSKLIREFVPDAIHIFSCAGRKAYWSDASPTYELMPFADIAPSMGFFTRGEFMRTNDYLNLHNVTLVIAAMREGEAGEVHDYNAAEGKLLSLSRIPLVSRIANFIAESARELEAINTRLESTNRQLQAAVAIDGLTGLYNRKEMQERITEQLDKVGKHEFCLIMIDIDNFKSVNDKYGHKMGDNVIIALSEIIKTDNGSGGFSGGRWGGEEFMVLLPDTNLAAAADTAEMIRKTFEKTEYPYVSPQTISLGVTQARTDDTIDTLCIRVDAALYQAKQTGKNKVVKG